MTNEPLPKGMLRRQSTLSPVRLEKRIETMSRRTDEDWDHDGDE